MPAYAYSVGSVGQHWVASLWLVLPFVVVLFLAVFSISCYFFITYFSVLHFNVTYVYKTCFRFEMLYLALFCVPPHLFFVFVCFFFQFFVIAIAIVILFPALLKLDKQSERWVWQCEGPK